ncbi:MAG: hypothetical protein KBC78_01205 [Candidatus Pacebacteria bacterium]|nr:hypothetical protein [Candidatus Paceibacterota bacterium]
MNNKLSLQLNDYQSAEAMMFTEEVGTLVFQSALMKYLASESDEVTREFETYINLQVGSEKFIENLCTKYPTFGEILNFEMMAFKSELESL